MPETDPARSPLPELVSAAGRLAEIAGAPAGVGLLSALLEWGAGAVRDVWEENRERILRSPLPLSAPESELPDPVLRARLEGRPGAFRAAVRALEKAEPAALRAAWGTRPGGPAPGETFADWAARADGAGRKALLDALLARAPGRLRSALREAEAGVLERLARAVPGDPPTAGPEILDVFLRLAAEAPDLLKDPRVRKALQKGRKS